MFRFFNNVSFLKKIGIGTATVSATALAEFSSTTQGVLHPRMTTTQRDAIVSPALGLQIFNTTSDTIDFYNGTIWSQLLLNPLPVNQGGTNTQTAFTQGSALFAGPSGTYAQDNANLFWNNTSKSLGIGTATPAATAALDITSTTKGLLLPRLTTAQRAAIVSPALGLQIFNTTLSTAENFDGTSWKPLGGGGGGASGTVYFEDINAANISKVNLYNNAGVVPTSGTGGVTTGLTAALNTTTPLLSTSSYRISKDAADRQGLGASLVTDITLDDFVKDGEEVSVQFRFRTSANYVSGDVKLFAIYSSNVYPLTGFDNVGFSGNNLNSSQNFLGQFTSRLRGDLNTSNIRLCFHITTVNNLAYTIDIDQITIGIASPFINIPQPTITNWVAAGPLTITGTTTNPTKATTRQEDSVRWRQVGENYEVEYRYRADVTTGAAAGSGGYLFALPPGVAFADDQIFGTISTTSGVSSEAASPARVNAMVGEGLTCALGSSSSRLQGFAYAVSGNRFQVSTGANFASGGIVNSGYFHFAEAEIGYSFNLSFKGRGLTATNPNILAAPETFSSDTVALAYASSSAFTLATLNTAPVGTFITFTYAASGNTRTQTTTAPTQTVASMNTNGIEIFARAFNAASTAGSPAVIAIQIGRNLKGKSIDLYKSVGKVIAGTTDHIVMSSTDTRGISFKDYNEVTGILTLDAGWNPLATVTLSQFVFNDVTQQVSGFLVINASRSPALTSVPALVTRIATIKDIKASATNGGTATSGSYQTRTLNTLSDPTGVVTSLGSNQFVLPAGEYYIEASAPAHYVLGHKTRLRNITDSADTIIGSSELSHNTLAVGTTTRSIVEGSFLIASAKTFELQHRVETTNSNTGFGRPSSFGDSEVYTQVTITKIR